jgi:hypothetical protein
MNKKEHIANHIQYQNLTKLYKQFFSRQIEKGYETLIENFIEDIDYYGLINEKDVEDLKLITKKIEKDARRQLIHYQNKLITKNKELC